MANQHALLSPSSSSRWLKCPASVVLGRSLEARRQGSYEAAEGTAAHYLADFCLRRYLDARDFAGKNIGFDNRGAAQWEVATESYPWVITVDKEMAYHISAYLFYLRSQEGELRGEERVSISGITGEPCAYGTVDAYITCRDALHVYDLKYGKGLSVKPDGNPQMEMYAMGLIDRMAINGVNLPRIITLNIIQPRMLGELCQYAEYSLAELLEAKKRIKAKAEYALGLKTPTKDDFSCSVDTCRFCRAKAVCPEMVLNSVGIVSKEAIPNGISPTVVEELSNSDLEKALDALPLIRQWMSAVTEEAVFRLKKGGEETAIGKYRLKKGRGGNRQWLNESALDGLPEEVKFKKILVSPAELERLRRTDDRVAAWKGWEKASDLVYRSEGKLHISKDGEDELFE